MGRVFAGALVAACVFGPQAAEASGITGHAYGTALGAAFGTGSHVNTACTYNYYSQTTNLSGNCGYMDTGGLTQNASDGSKWIGTGDYINTGISSSVDASGGLHALLDMTVFQYPVDPYSGCTVLACSAIFYADAYAYSQDVLTFSTNGPQIPVQAVFTVTVDGSQSATDAKNVLLSVDDAFETFTTTGSHSGTYTVASPLQAGNKYYTYLYLHLSAQVYCTSQGTGPNSGVHLCTNTVDANYQNTEKYTGITIEDLQGNPLTGYTVSSQSGYDYNSLLGGSGVAAAPEPGSLVLAGLGGLICLGVGRRVTFRA